MLQQGKQVPIRSYSHWGQSFEQADSINEKRTNIANRPFREILLKQMSFKASIIVSGRGSVHVRVCFEPLLLRLR